MLVTEQTWHKVYRHDLLWQLEREVKFLQRLAPYRHFPRLLGRMKASLLLSHCGRQVAEAVGNGLSMGEVEHNLKAILAVLTKEGIIHRDITVHNLLWHPTAGLHLIDFGWSIWADEEDTPIPVPHVMREWMCEHSDEEQAEDTLRGLRDDS